jgi:hypothetical protein
LDSLEENISYTLMGKYNLMLYPYITILHQCLLKTVAEYSLNY